MITITTTINDLVDGAILEELHHFQQLVEKGWLGRMLKDVQVDWLEEDVVQRLLDSWLKELF